MDLIEKLNSLNDLFFVQTSEKKSTKKFFTIIHRETGIEFKYIPGGYFNMGLSRQEEINAKKICDYLPFDACEMKPYHRVKIQPFLVSQKPVLNITAKLLIGKNIIKEENPYFPAFLTREQSQKIASKLNCRLPLESEWEYFCRAGTNTLFIFGDKLLNSKAMERWLLWDFSDLGYHSYNSYGLYGLFVGEWCNDRYRKNYSLETPIAEDVHVIRGGGALFWPWQDQEWIWCMSAMRMPSTDLFEDRRCGMRLVYDLR